MTVFVLIVFKVLLYVQLFICIGIGYIYGTLFGLPFLPSPAVAEYVQFAGPIGAVVGLIIGTMISGYGLVLLSINSHMARLNNRISMQLARDAALPRVEPQFRS